MNPPNTSKVVGPDSRYGVFTSLQHLRNSFGEGNLIPATAVFFPMLKNSSLHHIAMKVESN